MINSKFRSDIDCDIAIIEAIISKLVLNKIKNGEICAIIKIQEGVKVFEEIIVKRRSIDSVRLLENERRQV